MHWLHPAGAWALLSLAAIAALYLLRRRSESHTVPSLLLWQRAAQEQQAMRPFQKLKKKILLFLQLALAALLAVSLMRPAVSGGVRGETVFVFDLSASMQTVEDGQSRLQEAQRRANALIDSMEPGDRVTVLAAGAQANIALSRSADLSRARAVIDGLRAGNGGADLPAAVSLAQAMARDIDGLNILVFSDTYAGADAQVIRVGQPAQNRALLSLSVGEGGQAFARVANYGDAASVTLECYADGNLCDMAAVEAGAGETVSALLQAPAGARTVQVKIAGEDALAADDSRWYAARSAASYRAVLCGDNLFLEKALSLRADLTLLRASVEEISDLTDIDLFIFDGALPETLPETGMLLCVAPTGTVLGVSPGETASASGALRAGAGDLAGRLTENLSLSDIALRRCTPLEGGEPVLTLGGKTLLAAAEADGRRAAVLGFDLHDSNLPLKGDFPVLIQNLLSWLLPDARSALADGVCGQTVALPADARAQHARVITPSGRTLPAEGALEDTGEMGVYTLEYAYADGAVRSLPFAMHMDTDESDVRQVGSATGDVSLGGTAPAGMELTHWVLLALLALLLVEWGVSRRVG